MSAEAARAFLTDWLKDIGYEKHLYEGEENEKVAAEFSGQNPDFEPVDVAHTLQALKVPQAATLCRQRDAEVSQLRLWPHLHRVDGFFAAIWQKK